ncbi:hypothetical protein TRFO_14023 [Tritrichomonas foetus]|uniref:Inner centromere protein ARK-binding domain-containing protein n=1 Tax=Tritrichomonas foetus TaxID=1144522 RepID=A0A1J4L186_9EUKA|nr:hypothetical protein TRFO_14023 [Tritrichomonas foetus]|eukprot:OHT15645.1 hypothetical protein TRFO_14023 [Tritrichomonas foetus]
MIENILDAAQRIKNEGAAAEDDLNRQSNPDKEMISEGEEKIDQIHQTEQKEQSFQVSHSICSSSEELCAFPRADFLHLDFENQSSNNDFSDDESKSDDKQTSTTDSSENENISNTLRHGQTNTFNNNIVNDINHKKTFNSCNCVCNNTNNSNSHLKNHQKNDNEISFKKIENDNQNISFTKSCQTKNDNHNTSTKTKLKPISTNYSDLVRNSTDFLRNIITSLQIQNDPYELSDWEDEDAMKPMDLDLDAEIVNGKTIPAWACGKQLSMAMARQNQTDGDRIFQELPRRVNIVDLFGTNVFSYYQRVRH